MILPDLNDRQRVMAATYFSKGEWRLWHPIFAAIVLHQNEASLPLRGLEADELEHEAAVLKECLRGFEDKEQLAYIAQIAAAALEDIDAEGAYRDGMDLLFQDVIAGF